MKMKKENKNFLYNIVYQVFVFIIPLITTPYISRVLGANNIGIYAYTYSFVYYFMLGTLLGINNYGTRSIAKVSHDKKKLLPLFSSIYYLQLFLGICMLISYNLLIEFLSQECKPIFLLQNIFLVSAIVDINWLYFGLEKFKITISRNIIIKILSLILVFLFVKTSNDLVTYTLIMSISTLISQIYLWLFLKKNEISLVKVPIKDIFSHLKKCLILFIPVISYSIYRVMDKTMLGAISGTISLGYYENAEKIINIPISIVTALGTVMLPNISKISDNDKKMKEKIYDSFELCFFCIMPMVIGLFLIAKDFSIVFFGSEFLNSGTIIKMLVITIIFSGISNVIRTNYLIPNEKDRVYIISTIIGAIVNFIINLILIPQIGFYGVCIGTICAEFILMFYQAIMVRKEIELNKVIKLLIKYLYKSVYVAIVVIIIGKVIDDLLIKLILQMICAVIVYVILNYKYILYEFLGMKKSVLSK